MLQLDQVVLTQGEFRLAADWSVAPGSRVAIIGASGEGKSSLLLAIAGFLPLARGRILWQGRDLRGAEPAARPAAMLFQDQNLFPHLTIAQNLGLAVAPRGRLSAEHSVRVLAMLERLGLADVAARRPGDLSGGQQGRAALGRALLQTRPMLLLDEPFAALGPALKAELLDLVADLARDVTVMMVTHNPDDARRFADVCVLVAEGEAQPPQPTAALFANPPQALRHYLGG